MFHVHYSLNGANAFNQWDKNQKVYHITNQMDVGDKVIFRNSSGMTYTMKAYQNDNSSMILVDVPNELLTMASPILICVDGKEDTKCSINVVAKDKPTHYVFEDNTVKWPSNAAEMLVANGQAGGVEKYTFTHDGKNEGKESFTADGMTYVRVGGVVDFKSITHLGVYYYGHDVGTSMEYCETTVDQYGNIAVETQGMVGLYIQQNRNAHNVSAGTYVLSEPDMPIYVTSVDIEHINHIDPKYLPDVADLSESWIADLKTALGIA